MGPTLGSRCAIFAATIGISAVLALVSCVSDSQFESGGDYPAKEHAPLLSPETPAALQVVATGRLSAIVKWDSGSESIGNYTTSAAYEIRWRNINVPPEQARSAIAYEEAAILNSLKPGSVYEIDVRALSNSGVPSGWTDKKLAATPINRPPEFEGETTGFTVPEGSIGLIGWIKVADPDGDEVTFHLDSTESPFEIASASGALRVAGNSRLNFIESAKHRIGVIVVDEFGASTRIPVTVFVEDLPPPPRMERPKVQEIVFRAAEIEWKQLAPPVPNGGLSYELRFRLSDSADWHFTNYLYGRDSASIGGLLPASEYEVQIRAINHGGIGSWSPIAALTTEPNRPPVFNSPNPTVYVDERAIGIRDPSLGAKDADGDRFEFELISDSDLFMVDRNSGHISVVLGNQLDYERNNWYQLEIRVVDEFGAEALQLATIRVTDVPPPFAPVDIKTDAKSRFESSISWNHSHKDGRATASGFEYTLSRSGQFSWADPEKTSARRRTVIRALQANTAYDVLVRAVSEEGASEWSFLHTFATDANRPPQFTPESFEVLIQPDGTIFGSAQVLANDPDGDTIAYSLLGERDEFSIDARTGGITLSAQTYLRPPRGTSIGAVAVATDEYGATAQVELAVKFAAEPIPAISSDSPQTSISDASPEGVECTERDRGRADARRQAREFRANAGLDSGETEEEARYWDALIAACEAVTENERRELSRAQQEALREAGAYNPNRSGQPTQTVVASQSPEEQKILAAQELVYFFLLCVDRIGILTPIVEQRHCYERGVAALNAISAVHPNSPGHLLAQGRMETLDWIGFFGPRFQPVGT